MLSTIPPDARVSVEAIHKKHHAAHSMNGNPVAPYAGAMTQGDLRLAQAYLSVMDYFGPINSVHGKDVVHGHLDQRTQYALNEFAFKHRMQYHLPELDNGTAHATTQLLNAIQSEYTSYMHDKAKPALDEKSYAVLERRNLIAAFALQKPIMVKQDHADRWALLNQLHPVMRFPALKAIEELEAMGIKVQCCETYRKPQDQIAYVKQGASMAPPGTSFHALGLAIDMKPVQRGHHSLKDDWNTLHQVMEKYGFYSMELRDHWDPPHHEMPAHTRELIDWAMHKDGWKDIPEDKIPARWNAINKAALKEAHLEVSRAELQSPPLTFQMAKKFHGKTLSH